MCGCVYMLVYVYAHLWTWGMCICGVFRKQNPLPSQNTNSWTFHESSDWPVTRHQPSGNGNGYDNIRMSNNTVCQGCQVTLWPKSTQAEIHYMDYLREREYGRARKQLYVCVCVCVYVCMQENVYYYWLHFVFFWQRWYLLSEDTD